MTIHFFMFVVFVLCSCVSFLWPSACDACLNFPAQLQELGVSYNYGNNFSKCEFLKHTGIQYLWVNLAGFFIQANTFSRCWVLSSPSTVRAVLTGTERNLLSLESTAKLFHYGNRHHSELIHRLKANGKNYNIILILTYSKYGLPKLRALT